MKRFLSFVLAATLVAFISIIVTDTASAQSAQGQGKGSMGAKWGSFDDDGDGILNCNDPDFVQPKDGTGKQLGKTAGNKSMSGKGGYGPGNGSGNNGIGPRDGSGLGRGTGVGTGTGVCDGSGPKGNGRSK